MNTKTLILLLLISLLLASCQSSRRFTSEISTEKKISKSLSVPSDENLSNLQKTVLNEAESLLGTPYCFGGISADCFDCSGFVSTVYQKAGINLPRTSSEQFEFGSPVTEKNKEPGDLIFFGNSKGISHVGIYIGKERFIHASTSKGVIIQSVFDDYYLNRFVGFRRVIGLNYLGNK